MKFLDSLPPKHIWKFASCEFHDPKTGESLYRYVCERCGKSTTAISTPEDGPRGECQLFLLKSVMEK